MADLLCLFSAGGFLLVGLLCGVWKYRQMMASPTHQAHVYVDVAHRAALLYSFACLVLRALVAESRLPGWLEVMAAGATILFFALAVATYICLGRRRLTENQFERRTLSTTVGMWALIAGEIGGVSILLLGAILAQL
jgi:hypothetical protein